MSSLGAPSSYVNLLFGKVWLRDCILLEMVETTYGFWRKLEKMVNSLLRPPRGVFRGFRKQVR